MPTRPPDRPPERLGLGPSRRALLGCAAAAGLAGCTGRRRRMASPSPDERLIEHLVSDKRELLAAYAATAAAHPGLAERLAPIVATHEAHLAALDTGGSPTSSGTPADRADRRGVPARPGEALAALAARERAAARARLSQILPASPALARLVASIGAAEAVHAVLLGRSG